MHHLSFQDFRSDRILDHDKKAQQGQIQLAGGWLWHMDLAHGFGIWIWHMDLAYGFGTWIWHDDKKY